MKDVLIFLVLMTPAIILCLAMYKMSRTNPPSFFCDEEDKLVVSYGVCCDIRGIITRCSSLEEAKELAKKMNNHNTSFAVWAISYVEIEQR